MKKSIFYFMLLMLTCISINAQAEEAEYNSESKILKIPAVKVNGDEFYNVEVKINDFENITPPVLVPGPEPKCSAENATNFQHIKNGDSLDDLNGKIGCTGILKHSAFDDGILKEKYIWKFTPGDASIELAFEKGRLVL